ncbi:MAG: hypothetical protein RLY31_250 [Bacteroidota bacterium]
MVDSPVGLVMRQLKEMRYFILAGEASGDLHGARLVEALRSADAGADIRCWGGERMAAAGARLTKHYRELAFMGFVEVVKHLPEIIRNFRICRQEIRSFRPDGVILIDYPGFNLRMARWAHRQGFRVYYYIAPQLWAWHSSRVSIIRDHVRLLFCILPFEKAFFASHGVDAQYVGHPLTEILSENPLPGDGIPAVGPPVVALLPGSRVQEIRRMLPVMARVAERHRSWRFVVAAAPSVPAALYDRLLGPDSPVTIVYDQTYGLLREATAALVTSGTATLETALHGVPQVVCYKGGRVSYWLARRLVNPSLRFISLVNLVIGRPLVRELIQQAYNPDQLDAALRELFLPAGREAMLSGYAEIRRLLGSTAAAQRTAGMIVADLERLPQATPKPGRPLRDA